MILGSSTRHASEKEDDRVKRIKRAQPIRVLLIEVPQLLSDIIKGIISSYEDINIVGEITIPDGLFRAASTARADVIVLHNAAVSTDNCYELLYRRPRLKILAITADGRQGLLYELQPSVQAFGEMSAENFIAAIRSGTSVAGRAVTAQ
jgi:DNA-binding NarL/FixJ family response regulator